MPAHRNPIRDRILLLFRRGLLASAWEGALIAGVSREAIRLWLREAGIDLRATRARYLAQMRRRAMMIEDGKRPVRQTKLQQSGMLKRKTAEWLDKGNTIKRSAHDAEHSEIPD